MQSLLPKDTLLRTYLPWLTQEIKRLIKNRIEDRQEAHHFKEVKHHVQAKLKAAYTSYIQNILCLSEGGDDNIVKNSRSISKKALLSYKNATQDTQGVSPLKNPNTNTTSSLNKEKANILNREFQSVLSQLSPLKLGQICIDKLQLYFNQHLPDKFTCNYPQMSDICINLNGITRLLSNLRPNKATGPDEIRPIVLNELRSEIALIIQLIFKNH